MLRIGRFAAGSYGGFFRGGTSQQWSCRRLLDKHHEASYILIWLISRLAIYMAPNELDRVFAALADPTRRAIVERLASGESTVMALSEPFDMTQPSISKHLKVLERAGLISRSRAAQTRPCRLEAAPLRRIGDWLDMHRSLWEGSLDRLDEFLKSTTRKSSTPSQGKRNGRRR